MTEEYKAALEALRRCALKELTRLALTDLRRVQDEVYRKEIREPKEKKS